jgi:hypothetical protein
MLGDNPTLGINPLIVFHQNICGLRNKIDELISSVFPDLPHIMCLTEHHLKQLELDQISMDGYRLPTSYYRKSREKGEVCIFVRKNFNFLKIDLSRFCKDHDNTNVDSLFNMFLNNYLRIFYTSFPLKKVI